VLKSRVNFECLTQLVKIPSGAGNGNRTRVRSNGRARRFGRRYAAALADQFKSIGEDQGMAFSGRCGLPQPWGLRGESSKRLLMYRHELSRKDSFA
jgi:hypothetical protein